MACLRAHGLWLALLLSAGCGRTQHVSQGVAGESNVMTPSAPTHARCDFDAPDDPSAPALLAVQRDRLVLVRADGSAATLRQFESPDEEPDALHSFGTIASLRGGRIAADVRTSYFKGASAPRGNDWYQGDDLFLLTLEGDIVWQRHVSSDELGLETSRSIPMLLGPRGELAVTADGSFFVWPDGREESLGDYYPRSAPAEGPRLVVTGTSDTGWWGPGEGFVPLRQQPAWPYLELVADRLVYRANSDAGPILISESLDPAHDVLSTDVGSEVISSSASGWVLIRLAPQVFARFNVVSGEVSSAPLTPPAGFRDFGSIALDDDGSVVWALRNDYSAGVFRSQDGSHWTPVGRTLGQVEEVRVEAADGTYFIEARGTNEFFVPMADWSAQAPAGAEPELLQGSTQFVRPETNVSESLSGQVSYPTISRDGQCLVYVQDSGSVVKNMKTGKAWPLPAEQAFHSFAWIE